MLESFHLGGWGMYPTTIAGLVLVITAARYAWSPDRRRLRLVRSLAWLTLLSSCLGFVTGVIKTFIACGDTSDPLSMALTGVGESLTNIGLGLVMLTVAAIGVTIGAARRDELPDPFKS